MRGKTRARVVVMIGDEAVFDAQSSKQAAGAPRVLARDQIDAGKHVAGAPRDVAEIADWESPRYGGPADIYSARRRRYPRRR